VDSSVPRVYGYMVKDPVPGKGGRCSRRADLRRDSNRQDYRQQLDPGALRPGRSYQAQLSSRSIYKPATGHSTPGCSNPSSQETLDQDRVRSKEADAGVKGFQQNTEVKLNHESQRVNRRSTAKVSRFT